MAYVDGFVIAVPRDRKDAFLAHARTMDAIFMEYGARRVVECWGEEVKAGTQTDFRRAVAATDDEEVVFAWIEWPDKATRDAAFGRIMQDPRTKQENNPMPFDGKRMIFGGFVPVVDLGG